MQIQKGEIGAYFNCQSASGGGVGRVASGLETRWSQRCWLDLEIDSITSIRRARRLF